MYQKYEDVKKERESLGGKIKSKQRVKMWPLHIQLSDKLQRFGFFLIQRHSNISFCIYRNYILTVPPPLPTLVLLESVF